MSKDYRHKILQQTTSVSTLNTYLWNMENLSKRKGEPYTKMYKEDVEYVINLAPNNNMFGGGNSLLDFFFKDTSKTKQATNNEHSLETMHTEQCIKKIHSIHDDIKSNNLEKNTLCAKCLTGDNRCEAKIDELPRLKRNIKYGKKVDPKNVRNSKPSLGNEIDELVYDSMKKFIDVLFCCGGSLELEENKINIERYIPKINQLILTKPAKYIEHLNKYIEMLKKHEPGKLYEKYITEFVQLPMTNRAENIQKLQNKYASGNQIKLVRSHVIATIRDKYEKNKNKKENIETEVEKLSK